jgi:hypothetical protein
MDVIYLKRWSSKDTKKILSNNSFGGKSAFSFLAKFCQKKVNNNNFKKMNYILKFQLPEIYPPKSHINHQISPVARNIEGWLKIFCFIFDL